MASSVVGTAYVRLRLLTDSIGKDIESAVKKQDFQDLDIHVGADTAEADDKLRATGVEADKLGAKSPTIKPKVDTKDAKKETSLLKDALVLLGPTIGPLAATAAAAFGALAASAGVAVVAVLGVKKEMKDASTVGVQFTAGIQTLKGDLSTLEATAARGVLPGFQQTVSSLNSALPGVNQSVGVLSRTLGDMAGHVVVGLVAGLQTFEPLLNHVATDADKAAEHFQKWATGSGGASFATSLGREFDLVIPVLVNLGQAAGKLVAAFTPVGNQIVGVLGTLTDVINAIPLPVLQAAATAFVSMYAAKRLIGVFDALSISVGKLGYGSGSLVGVTKSLGTLAATAVVVGQGVSILNNLLNDSAEKFAVSDKASTNLTDAFAKSKGTIDANVTSAQQYNLQQSGLADRAARSGISLDQLTQALVGPRKGFDQLINTWKASGDPSAQTLDAFRELRVQMFLSQDATTKQTAAQQALNKQLALQWPTLHTTADSVQQVADRYHVAADSVTQYASLVGISAAAIKNGTVTNKQLADAVVTVKGAYDGATMSGSAFLDALQKFSTSAGTAADRAQIIGATLKAANGDGLGFAQAMNSAYAANSNLVVSLKQSADQVGKNGESVGAYVRSIVNLKTGTIDYTNTAAGPLIQGLQGIQDAAMAAAQAQYQHEVSTRGGKKAADDAYNTYVKQTRGSLIDEAQQLGLTKDQAKRLADQYFGMPKDVKTKIEQEGADPVVTVLRSIDKILGAIAKSWGITVNADTSNAEQHIRTLQGLLLNLNANIESGASKAARQALRGKGATGGLITYGGIQNRAGGGPAGLVKGPGSGTADKAGLFALSNGEYVSTASSTARNYPALKAGNAGATLVAVQGMATGGMTRTKTPVAQLHHGTLQSTINARKAAAAAAKRLQLEQWQQRRRFFMSGWRSRTAAMMGALPTPPAPSPPAQTAQADLLSEIRALILAVQSQTIQLVPTNGGLPLAQFVNNANLVNARRTG